MASGREKDLHTPVRRGFRIVGKILAVFFKILGTLLLVGVLTMLIFGCIFARYVQTDLLPQAGVSLENVTLDQTSVIYYQDPDTGEYRELQRLYGEENRTWVSYEQIPQDLINACVAIEDKRFYEHQGVDWLRTASASVNLFLGNDDTYGASTITQQLIKNITGEREVTVRRKLLEIFSALEFEKEHTKREILTWYLNTIYLGEGCYGVQSASRVYFGKDVSELTTAECASLIGITNNPSIYDPYISEENNRERQLTILWEMYDQGYILTEEAYQEAVNQELVFRNGFLDDTGYDDGSDYYSYFVDQVIRDVTADLQEQYGYSERIAEQMVRSGGYAIYCTLNPEIQEIAESVYENLDNIPETDSEQQLQSGIAIIDNTTCDMVAVVGGVGEKTGSLTLNRATQSLLSPGSTIKPITVYGPAFDQGIITPATVYDDTPYSFDGGVWPRNTNRTYAGLMTIRSAISMSTNTVAVKVLADLTPEASFRFAREKLGMTTLVEEEVIGGQTYTDIGLAPLALGSLTRGTTIQDMAAAYAAYANGGTWREARTYTRVTRTVNGHEEVVLDNTQDTVQAVSTKAAWYMTDMLEYAVEHGTGSPAQIANMAVAGKTGTTDDDHDRWFCGYTPYYSAAVWCGYDLPEEVNLTSSSTNPAAYLWQMVMAQIHEGLEPAEFTRPTDVVEVWYCRDSGKLATDACRADPRGSRVVSGYLALEDAPSDYCDVHRMVEICDASGHMANEFCTQVEDNTTHEVGLLDVSRAFPTSGVSVSDQYYTIPDEGSLPSGYYPAVSSQGDPMGLPCTEHTEESIQPPEEDPNSAGDVLDPENPEDPDAPTDPNDPTNPSDPTDPTNPTDPSDPGGTDTPEDPGGTDGETEPPYEGWEDPADGGVVPND